MSTLSVGDLQGLAVNSNVVTVPTGHTLNVADAAGLQIGGSAVVSAGLVFISRTTIGTAVSSVTVSGAFSSDYDNYRIVIASVDCSANQDLGIRLSALTTGYRFAGVIGNYGTTVSGSGTTTGTLMRVGALSTDKGSASVDLYGPNLAAPTMATSISHYNHPTTGGVRSFGAVETSSTQHTAFTVLPDSGTMTGGTIDLYGYAKA